MNIKVRLGKPSDREEVMRIFKCQYVECPYFDVINRHFDGDKNIEILIAYDEETGNVLGVGINEYSKYKDTDKIKCHGMIGVVKTDFRRMGVLKEIRKMYMKQIKKKNVYYFYRKHQKDAPHINLDKERAAGFTVKDCGNNENILEMFLGE